MIQTSATCLAADLDGQICETRVTRRVPLVEQELFPHPKHLRSPPVFSGVRVARSLVFSVLFCRSLFVLLSLFISPFYYVSFFYLRVRPLVSSNLHMSCPWWLVLLFPIFTIALKSPLLLQCNLLPLYFNVCIFVLFM
jgi:hypothetical protein